MAVSVTVPMLIPVIKPVLVFTVAEPPPVVVVIEYVMLPPLPKVALVVVVAVSVPSTFTLFAEVIVSVGVILLIVNTCVVLVL